MVGKYNLEISGLGIKYKIHIERAITVIKGKSGTGKTTLCSIVREILNGSKGYSSNMREKIYVLDNISPWEILIPNLNNKIIFIDESSKYLYTTRFAEIAQSSDNYFVIITRRNLDYMTYSYKSIYELSTVKKDKLYETTLVYKYSNNLGKYSSIKHSAVLCEDKKSGYQMFKLIINNDYLKSACGKDNIQIIISKNKLDKYYVIADGAGFGNCIEGIVNLMKEGISITLLLDESFEKMILDYPKFYSLFSDEVENTYNYCDSKEFKSYERYYEYLLNKVCKKLFNKSYKKDKLLTELKNKHIIEFIKTKLITLNRDLLIK